MANLTNDLKNALSSAVSGAGDVAGTVQRVTKDNVVSLLQGAGGVATASLQTVDQVVAEGLQAVISTGASLTDGVSGLIRGVVGGAKDTGVNVVEAAGEAAAQAVKTASTGGGDISAVANSFFPGGI